MILHWPHLNSPFSPLVSITSSNSLRCRVNSFFLVLSFLPLSALSRDGRTFASLWIRESLSLSCWSLNLLLSRWIATLSGSSDTSSTSELCKDDLLFCTRHGLNPLSTSWRSSCSSRTDPLTREAARIATGCFTLDTLSKKKDKINVHHSSFILSSRSGFTNFTATWQSLNNARIVSSVDGLKNFWCGSIHTCTAI